MSDDLELKRLIEIFGREEADEAAQFEPDADFWQQVEIWQTDSGAPEDLPDGEIDRLLALYGEPADSATDGEISAELMEEIKDWLHADQISQAEADANAARELDELVERFRNEPDL
jgi:hypothetical protein